MLNYKICYDIVIVFYGQNCMLQYRILQAKMGVGVTHDSVVAYRLGTTCKHTHARTHAHTHTHTHAHTHTHTHTHKNTLIKILYKDNFDDQNTHYAFLNTKKIISSKYFNNNC